MEQKYHNQHIQKQLLRINIMIKRKIEKGFLMKLQDLKKKKEQLLIILHTYILGTTTYYLVEDTSNSLCQLTLLCPITLHPAIFTSVCQLSRACKFYKLEHIHIYLQVINLLVHSSSSNKFLSSKFAWKFSKNSSFEYLKLVNHKSPSQYVVQV